jgi:hypothetical protein
MFTWSCFIFAGEAGEEERHLSVLLSGHRGHAVPESSAGVLAALDDIPLTEMVPVLGRFITRAMRALEWVLV